MNKTKIESNEFNKITKEDLHRRNKMKKEKRHLNQNRLAGHARKLFREGFNALLFAYLIIISLIVSVNGQEFLGKTTPAAFKTDISGVNPYNGKLNTSVPLVSVGGRGNAGYQITINNNFQWISKNEPDEDGDGSTPIGMALLTYGPTYQPGNIPGTGELGLPKYEPGLMVGRTTGEMLCGSGSLGLYAKTITYFTFVAPDGSETDFYDDLTKGSVLLNHCSTPININRGNVFYSVKGDGATYITDQNVRDSNGDFGGGIAGGDGGYLKFKNGTIYRIHKGKVLWIQDANGNKTTFTYVVLNQGTSYESFGKLIKVTDSLNREVNISYASPTTFPSYDELSYKGSGGATRTIRVNYNYLNTALKAGNTIKTTGQLFPEWSPWGDYTVDFPVITSIQMPDGRAYQFQYNSYSEVARIIFPTGAAIEYDYTGGYVNGPASGALVGIYRGVYRRTVEERTYVDGVNLTNKTKYSRPETSDSQNFQYSNSGFVDVEQFDPSNNLLNKVRHYYSGYGGGQTIQQGWLIANTFHLPWNNGLETQTDVFDTNGTTVLRRTLNTWQTRFTRSWGGETPQITESVSIIEPSGANLQSKTTYGYDQYGNVTDTFEYDFGAGTPGGFLRRSHTDYITDPNYTSYNNAHIRNLASQTWVSSDSNGSNIVSRTQIEYDNYSSDSRHAPLASRSSVIGHDTTNFGSGYPWRGNPTQTVSFGNAANQTDPVYSSIQYDILGNPVKTIDANGNASLIYYNDNFGAPNAEARTNSAPGQLSGNSTFAFATSATNPAGWTTYAQFDYFTGAVVDAEDIHGNVSSSFYNDALDRPTQTILANNTGLKQQTSIVYDDANRRIQSTSDLFNYGDNLAKTESFYDGLGRTFESRNYRDGTYVISNTEYDALGRVKRVTNPYKPGESQLWTTTTYDALSRPLTVTTPDNAVVTTAYSGNVVTVTDQAGKQRRSITNALGQLVRVDEPDDSGNLGSVGSPTQATAYTYDTLNNLVQVNQGVQQRNFGYDSLSRLRQAVNPESGQISYNYDNNGKLTQKTDARGVVTNYVYDNINWVTSRNYSDGTPTVTYTYENGSIPFSKGRLTQVSSSISTTNYNSFDNMGRVLASQQITDGQTYNFGYTYNLAGMLVEETYPSGRKVKNTFENDGDLALVETQIGGGNYQGRVGNFTYNSAGAVTSMQLGNGKWENTVFNSRLQPIQIGLGNSQTTQELWKVNYDYGTTDNNGNVKGQTITVPSQFTAVQNYTYDSLNRLKSATETIGGNQTWKQTFTFDRYGNRKFDASQTTTLGGCPVNVCNPDINPNNNRITTHNFDNAGNTTVDAEGRQFFYDGENKQKEVKNSANQVIGQYLYDGDGKRVKKVSAAETTLFIYNASGKMTSEYTVTTATPTAPVTSYLTNDTLGSPRVTTDSSGNVTSRRDFRPYGEEIHRPNQGTDKIRQKFTSYERDDETDLDFAQARMYQNKLGRFTAVDFANAGADEFEPQSWNGYSYVSNNPLNMIDPSGLCGTTAGSNDGTRCIWIYNEKDGYKSVSEAEFGNRSNFAGYSRVQDPSSVILDNPVFTGSYANVEAYQNFQNHKISVGLGDDGMFHAVSSTDVNILDDVAGSTLVAGTTLTFPALAGSGGTVITGVLSNPVTASGAGLIGTVGAWWWLYFPAAPPSQPMRTNSSTSMANTAIPAFTTTKNCACSIPILMMAKGGKQNIKNEWNKAAVDKVGGDVAKQLEWLAEAAKSATKADKQKIKTAEKALGGRKSSGGDGTN